MHGQQNLNKKKLKYITILSLHMRMCKAADMYVWIYMEVGIRDRSPSKWDSGSTVGTEN